MDPPCRGQLLHSQRFLHVLGQLRFPHRSYDFHSPRPRSSRRLRPQLVGNVSRELGSDRFEPLAGDYNWLNCRNVCCHHRPHRCSLRFLRWFRVHPQPVLYHFQLDPMHHHHDHVYPPRRSRAQPSIWSRSGQHGCRLLYISDCICRWKPRDGDMQEPDSESTRHEDHHRRSWSDLYILGYRVFYESRRYAKQSACR